MDRYQDRLFLKGLGLSCFLAVLQRVALQANKPLLGVFVQFCAVFGCVMLCRNTTSKRCRAGSAILGLGGLLNALAQLSTGSMLVASKAVHQASAAGFRTVDVVRPHTISTNSLAAVLGDHLFVPQLRLIVSPGDVLLVIGVLILSTSYRPSRVRFASSLR